MITYFYLLLKIVFIINLIFLAVIDIKTKLVPKRGQAIALSSGCACLLLSILNSSLPQLMEGININELSKLSEIIEKPQSLIAGFAVLLIICVLVAVFTGGLGGGDVKIFSAVGLSSGLQSGLEILMLTLILSGVFCVFIKIFPKIFKRLKKLKNIKEIPLIPFIAVASLLQFLEKSLYC